MEWTLISIASPTARGDFAADTGRRTSIAAAAPCVPRLRRHQRLDRAACGPRFLPEDALMPNITQPIERGASNPAGAGVWRDIARLAAEAVAIGLAFSVLLALAVF